MTRPAAEDGDERTLRPEEGSYAWLQDELERKFLRRRLTGLAQVVLRHQEHLSPGARMNRGSGHPRTYTRRDLLVLAALIDTTHPSGAGALVAGPLRDRLLDCVHTADPTENRLAIVELGPITLAYEPAWDLLEPKPLED
jgi:hypothetical protein